MKLNHTKHLMAVVALAGFAILLLEGCGGGANDPTSVALRPNKEPAPRGNGAAGNGTTQNGTTPKESEPAAGFGSIKGRIVIAEADKGSLPPAGLTLYGVGRAAVDPNFCAREMPIPNETLIVNRSNMGLQNAFLYLERKPRGGKPAAESQSAWPTAEESGGKLVLDQKNCTFVPHAMIVMAGQNFVVQSQDAVVHSYKGSPPSSGSFNFTIPAPTGGMPASVELNPFKAPERSPVPVSCATHSWMSGYQLPLDHPYGAVTDADGNFTISDLPSGKHTFAIWHEKKGKVRDYPVTVKADETVELTIELRLSQLN